MKRIIGLALVILCIAIHLGVAENIGLQLADAEAITYGSTTWYHLQPGLYRIGDTIPQGTYDVRIAEGAIPCDIAYSYVLTDEGALDMDFFYSYEISVFSQKWPGGAHPVIIVDNGGYLLIAGKSCRLYPVQVGY